MEIRSYGAEARTLVLPESRTVEGYAIVFGQRSRVLFDRKTRRTFTEVISPDAVSGELLSRSDVKALLEHDGGRLLARSVNGAGTLKLEIDDYGVKYRFEAPATPDGDYVVELVRRGDLFGSSFAYATDEVKHVRYEQEADGTLLRRVERIDWIGDVSIVSDPAYMGTDVEVRSLAPFFESDKEDEADYLREAEELRRLAR